MTPFPKPCGRLDWHDPHTWAGHWLAGTTTPVARDYNCAGRILIEGGYWADWDAEDDAAEERMIRDAREAS